MSENVLLDMSQDTAKYSYFTFYYIHHLPNLTETHNWAASSKNKLSNMRKVHRFRSFCASLLQSQTETQGVFSYLLF